MLQVVLEKHHCLFPLHDPPLGKGGEAAVYEVPPQENLPTLVAKIYHQPTPRHALKLEAMIDNPPADPMAGEGHVSIAWPIDRVRSADLDRCFLGFVMARVAKAKPLFELYNPKSRLRLCPLFHFGYLMRAARNLASAVAAVHERGYVIGDLNESNILINNQALVTIVDTDSFQVSTRDENFRCPVGKPEYTAPELQGVDFATVDRAPAHDNFALAVLIFQLLMQGIHPFAGQYTGPGEPGTVADRIAAGHWPYHTTAAGLYRPNPHAPPWDVLPSEIRGLFNACFQEGHALPQRRPSAGTWCAALREAEGQLQTCPRNPQHLFDRELAGCPWCLLARRQRRNLFPTPEEVDAGLAGVRPPPSPGFSPAPPRALAPTALVTASLVTLPPVPVAATLGRRYGRATSSSTADSAMGGAFAWMVTIPLVFIALLLALHFSAKPNRQNQEVPKTNIPGQGWPSEASGPPGVAGTKR